MNNHPVKLSAVVITYNEEKNIGRCLASVRDIADEIIVIDSYTTDGTRKEAEKYAVRFIQNPFQGYIEQKNFALAQAKYDHILSLDADEELSEELKKEISRIKSNWKKDGYYLNRLSRYCGQWIYHGAWHPDKKLRLFDRRKGQFEGFNPHDHFVLKPGAKCGQLKGKLLHYTYVREEDQRVKMQKFSDIQAREYFRHGVLFSVFKTFIHAVWRFVKDYFLKLGWLDGRYGFIIARNSAIETYMKYKKLRDLYLALRKDSSRKKVLFINTNKFWGGGEKWNLDIASYLMQHNINVFVIAAFKGALAKKCAREKIPYFSLRSGFVYYVNPLLWLRVMRLVRIFRPGTVVISLSNDLKLMTTVLKFSGIKNVIYRREIALPVSDTWSNRVLYQRVITHVVANSCETKRNILINNPELVPDTKISVIYNGINTQKFLQREARPMVYKKIPGEILIGNAGRLSEEKGQMKLIKLAMLLNRHQLPFRILIAGEGKLKEKLKSAIRDNNLDEKVVLLGFIERIKDFYETIDIFVLPSKFEGFGYVLLEAGLSGIPVVAFDIGSSREIIKDGETGFIVPFDELEVMEQHILELARDPGLREKIGAQAIRHIRDNFDQESSYRKFLKLIG